MDAEDTLRTLSNKEKLRAALKAKGVLTNHEARAIAGTRAMARCFELQHEGEAIEVRKLTRSTWELRYQQPALARSAETPVSYPDADCGPLFRSPAEQGAFQR